MLFENTSISGYRRLLHLARGGMSEAWLASPTSFGGAPFVVLKQLLPEFSCEPAAQMALEAEGQLLATLAHPNIIRSYAMTEVDGRLSLPLEFVYGDTLNQLQAQSLRKGARLPVTLSAHLLHQYASALSYLHQTRLGDDVLTHGDISPQNLMVSYSGHAKLIDFGVSTTGHTRGQMLAKPAYSSPEQMLGLASGPASDIFALGIVAWEMLVGRRLVRTNHPIQAANILLNQRIPSPRTLRPDVPVALESLVLQMLEPEPSARISAAELAKELAIYVHRHTGLERASKDAGTFMHRYAPEKKHGLRSFLSTISMPALDETVALPPS